MRALVLAGGKGTRLWPMTRILPKPFAPVANRPVLGWVLDHLDAAGVEMIGVIVRAAETDLYERGFGVRTAAGTPIAWLAEHEPLGSGGALRAQRDFFRDGPVLVVPADILCPMDLSALIAFHHRRRPAVTVAVMARDMTVWDGDVAVITPDGLSRYLFKPGPAVQSNLGSTGTWIVEPDLVDTIPENAFTDFSMSVLPSLPDFSLRLETFDTAGTYLRDVGTLDALLAANLEIVAGNAPLRPGPASPWADGLSDGTAAIDATATITGPVLVGADATIHAGAEVRGPAVIGPGAIVGPGARVDASLVLPGATVPARDRLTGVVHGDAGDALRVLTSRYADGPR